MGMRTGCGGLAAGVAGADEPKTILTEAGDSPAMLFPIVQDGKWGCMDEKGKGVIEPKCQPAREFSRGLARVQSQDADGDREGCVNKQGGYAWEPTKVGARDET